jgi:hypothetical protein
MISVNDTTLQTIYMVSTVSTNCSLQHKHSFQLTTSMKHSVKHTASQIKFRYNIVKSTVSCLHHNPQKKGKFSEFLSCSNVIFSDHLFPCPTGSSSVSDRSASSSAYTQHGWHGISLFPASLPKKLVPLIDGHLCAYFFGREDIHTSYHDN